jgi:hypothetical protein
MSTCDPTIDPSMRSRLTVRMEMFEVYEKCGGAMALLMVTSDPTTALKAATQPTDKIVKRWWVREGTACEELEIR